MRTQFLYAFLRPLRFIIGELALTCIIAIFISGRFTHESIDDDLASNHFFQDYTQLVVNISLMVVMVYLVYQPYTTNWWASSCYCRSVILSTFVGLGTFYATSLFIKIVAQNNGCQDPFFNNTRSRCYAQYAIGAAEYSWVVLIILELIIATRQIRDSRRHQEGAEQQLQNTVAYNPDLSLERPISQETVQMTDLSNSASTPGGRGTEELPMYVYEAPMNQRRVADMTNLPAAAGPRQEPETTANASSPSLYVQGSSLNNLPPPPIYKP